MTFDIRRLKEKMGLSSFPSVKEVYEQDFVSLSGYRSVVLIVPAVNSGFRSRYHVYRLNLDDMVITRLGRELDLTYARAVARRTSERDGKPVSVAEAKMGGWSLERWKREYGVP